MMGLWLPIKFAKDVIYRSHQSYTTLVMLPVIAACGICTNLRAKQKADKERKTCDSAVCH